MVGDDAPEGRVWVSELTISCQETKVLEALQYDLANPCIVHWCMLWFSAPTNLNRRLLNKFNEGINLAFQSAFILPFWRMTPRSCFLRSTHAVLCTSPERDWDANREMRGFGDWLRGSEDDLDSDAC